MTDVLRRAVMRDHTVHERPSTPLELLFDLCFVVAVAFLAAELHHGLAGGHAISAVAAYALLFVPIWWAWMSYSWFATAFSHDDAITRVLTLAQMGGVLALAAAIPSATRGELVPFAVAYAVMRLPLILNWLRSAYADPVHRAFALTYAAGSTVAQLLWVAGRWRGAAAVVSCSSRRYWSSWPRRSWRCGDRRTGSSIRATSRSATDCSPSSCWARPSSR